MAFKRMAKPALLTTAVLIYVLIQIRRRRNIAQSEKLSTKEPPTGESRSNWFLFLLMGHAADFKPWKVSLGMMSSTLLNERFRWYKSVKNADAVKVKIVSDNVVFLKDHATVEAVIGKEVYHFRNSDAIRRAWGYLFPKGVVVLKDESWRRVRKVLSSAIYKVDLPSLPHNTWKCLDRGLPTLISEDTNEIAVWETFAKITLDSFVNFTFGYSFNAMNNNEEAIDLLEMLKDLVRILADRMLVGFKFLWYLPFGHTPKIFKYRDRLEKYMDDKIQLRLDSFNEDPVEFKNKASKTILDALILTVQEEKTISREEIRAQLVALLFGGFDTTTSSLSFLFRLLCENPEYQEKLYEEVKDINLDTYTKKEMDNLLYLNGIIKESQRIYAVAPLVVRVPNEDVIINNVLFKKDTNIMIDSYTMCRDPKHWNNAQDLDQFRPERWFNFKPEPGIFSPFGFGARQCLGYRIGYTQLQSILIYLNQKFIFELSEKPIGVCFNLGFTVKPNVTYRVRRREK